MSPDGDRVYDSYVMMNQGVLGWAASEVVSSTTLSKIYRCYFMETELLRKWVALAFPYQNGFLAVESFPVRQNSTL